MSTVNVPNMNVSLYPLVPPSGPRPPAPDRIGPEASLNLEYLVEQVRRQVVFERRFCGGRWSVISVLAPYSPLLHLMIMETSKSRYIPGPEWVADPEGDQVMRICAAVLSFIAEAERGTADEIYAGYNWTPRAWGLDLEEGRGRGFQTVLTKLHFMLWARYQLPDAGKKTVINDYSSEWVPADSLEKQQARLIIENNYGKLLGRVMAEAVEKAFASRGGVPVCGCGGLLNFRRWSFGPRGITAPFRGSLLALLQGSPHFFTDVLKPMAVALEELMRELTEAMTSVNCRQMDTVLRRTEQGPLCDADLSWLRETPRLRPVGEIKAAFRAQGWPSRLLSALLTAVRARCEAELGHVVPDMWRKGFGYSMVFSSSPRGKSGEMRIMPSVYLGPGGVFETEAAVLNRVAQEAPPSELRRRGSNLQDLRQRLADDF